MSLSLYALMNDHSQESVLDCKGYGAVVLLLTWLPFVFAVSQRARRSEPKTNTIERVYCKKRCLLYAGINSVTRAEEGREKMCFLEVRNRVTQVGSLPDRRVVPPTVSIPTSTAHGSPCTERGCLRTSSHYFPIPATTTGGVRKSNIWWEWITSVEDILYPALIADTHTLSLSRPGSSRVREAGKVKRLPPRVISLSPSLYISPRFLRMLTPLDGWTDRT